MDRGQVIEILKFYRHIDGELRDRERQLRALEDRYNTLGRSGDGGGGGRSGHSDPTASAALHLPEGTREDIIRCREAIRKLQRTRRLVEADLDGLPYVQKDAIRAHYLQGEKWERVRQKHHYSEKQIRNIANAGLQRLGAVMETQHLYTGEPQEDTPI
ncbi:MAG: hypothetical protein LUG45_05265 [Clostridiales bacterium]|nr:hypothetical protein [Clostridiales bacterium]